MVWAAVKAEAGTAAAGSGGGLVEAGRVVAKEGSVAAGWAAAAMEAAGSAAEGHRTHTRRL